MGLVEVTGDDASSEPHLAVVRDRAVAGDQAQEVALTGAVRAEYGHPLTVPDLGVEDVGQAVQRHGLEHERLATGATALDADVDLLLPHRLGRLAALVELA